MLAQSTSAACLSEVVCIYHNLEELPSLEHLYFNNNFVFYRKVAFESKRLCVTITQTFRTAMMLYVKAKISLQIKTVLLLVIVSMDLSVYSRFVRRVSCCSQELLIR